MKRKLVYYNGLLSIIMATLLFLNTSTSHAALIEPHAYAKQDRNDISSESSKMVLNTGAEDLTSTWSSTNKNSFITKEMWVILSKTSDGQAKEWIEVGQVKGGVNGSYHDGHFTAVKRYQNGQLTYTESTIGTGGTSGSFTYEIKYGGKSSLGYDKWNIYINGFYQTFWTVPFIKSVAQHVGIESNDNLNKFKTGTKISNVAYLKDGTYYLWGSATNGDDNSLNWSSNFQFNSNTNSNTVTFSNGGV
ncbi:hypothetical protein RB620_28665 [Paenibacillus sp. LHD-117]|uniref:hypothetical protein n=1 Tax=Paenibacillus sp. LHD-117 TaxID=3071412 RepID=UPI0027DEB654|nr:hypothetical protein [Paenibacillus sp. LHD-117]MDQ6423394.1 hypothetical protein [Paenibacillus sp. LHD-117]